jgi:peroxiredoxin Q/BCP
LLWSTKPAAASEIRVSYAANQEMRVGDVLPPFRLPDDDQKVVDSSVFSGKPLIVLLDGATPSLSFGSGVAEAARGAGTRGFSLVLITPNALIGENYRLPAPFLTLRAGLGPSATGDSPLFLLVDRTGWIRESEILPATNTDPQSARLQKLLETAKDPTARLEIGQSAPDFSLRDANGNWRRVSALRGRKNLVLTFFPKCFTGRCRTHLSSLRDEFANFEASETEIWAVSVDPAQGEAGQQAFAHQLGLPFPLLPDEGRQLSMLYGAAGSPLALADRQSVLIDKNGVVRFIDRMVNPISHGADLLVKIRSLTPSP